MGKSGSTDKFSFLVLQNHRRWWLQPWSYRMLAPWKESYNKHRQHIKSRDITLLRKVCIVKAMVFPVVMYGCESWTIKKTEHQRINAFELFWLEKTLESESGEWKSWLKAQHSENEDHGIRSHHFMENRWGNSVRLYFWAASATDWSSTAYGQWVTAPS